MGASKPRDAASPVSSRSRASFCSEVTLGAAFIVSLAVFLAGTLSAPDGCWAKAEQKHSPRRQTASGMSRRMQNSLKMDLERPLKLDANPGKLYTRLPQIHANERRSRRVSRE